MKRLSLRERIAIVLYYEDNKRSGLTPWDQLSDERRKPWMDDAYRVLEVIEQDHVINPQVQE